MSDADVLRSLDPSADAGVLSALMRTAGRSPSAKVTAGELIARPALTVRPQTPIAEAARLMIESRYKILCVTDDDGRLLGVVDRADLLRAAGDALHELASLSKAQKTEGG